MYLFISLWCIIYADSKYGQDMSKKMFIRKKSVQPTAYNRT